LTVGQVHFIRRVSQEGKVRILNLDWEVPSAQPDDGVWATLEFTRQGATLRIFDAAPDAMERTCLAEYNFPLKEEVKPSAGMFQRPIPLVEHSLFRTVVDRAVDSFFSLISTML
jgi:hypothetical protein